MLKSGQSQNFEAVAEDPRRRKVIGKKIPRPQNLAIRTAPATLPVFPKAMDEDNALTVSARSLCTMTQIGGYILDLGMFE